jgi:hypothetical protein
VKETMTATKETTMTKRGLQITINTVKKSVKFCVIFCGVILISKCVNSSVC